MKSILKNTSKILFSLLLIFSIFSTLNVLAEEVIFQITNISVKEKSDKVTVNDVGISGGELKNDIVFTEKDDYIKYNITIKNTSTDEYTIKSISDNNTSPYLEYTYDDLSDLKLNSSEEKTFELQIKYVQETSNLTISDQAVSLILTYEKDDGTTGSEVITNNSNNDSSSVTNNITNPKTGDNITIYLLLGIISLIGLCVTTVNRRHLNKSLMSIAVLSMIVIPFGVKADSDKFNITFATNKVQNSYSELVSGLEFNLMISRLSSGNDKLELYYDDDECYIVDTNYTEDDDEYWYANTDIISIKKATSNQFNSVKDSLDEKNIVSNNNSTVLTYVWFDDGVIYYYANTNRIFMNSDSSYMFCALTSLNEIDLSGFDTSKVTNMSNMFLSVSSLKNLDLSSFDTSNVTNMYSMFGWSENLETIDLSSFNTSKVTDMSNMFISNSSLEELDLSGFDTGNVTNMTYMFAYCSSLTELDLSRFNTNKVTDMSSMFDGDAALKSIKFSSNFNTHNVKYMYQMFYGCSLLEELDLSSFDTSKVETFNQIFSNNENLKTIYVSDKFVVNDTDQHMFIDSSNIVGGAGTTHFGNNGYDAIYARIDGGVSNPGYFTDIADKPVNP